MLGKRLALDLGTSTVRAVVRGESGAIEEPPLVARLQRGGAAAGSAAVRALQESPEAHLARPLRPGGIDDSDALQTFVIQLANRAIGRQRIFKPDAIATVHTSWSGRDRRLLLDIFAVLGTRTAYLIDTPIAAAMGAGINVTGAEGHLVVDIGGHTVEVASLALEGRVAATVVARGAEELAASIGDAVGRGHGVEIDRHVAALLMQNVATAVPERMRRAEVAIGGGGAPEIGSDEMREPVAAHVAMLVASIREVLGGTPTALVDDILGEGIIVTGGGALLDGLPDQLAKELGMPVRVADDPLWSGVRGAAAAFDSLDVLKRNFMYIR